MKAIGKCVMAFAGVALAAALASAPAAAAELVMFERAGCIWCMRWHREVGTVYARTPEGRLAPLRRVDIGTGRVELAGLAAPIRYTPTFVLMDRGREVGRITGYGGEDAFWGLLGKMLAERPPTGLPSSATTKTMEGR